MKRLIPFVFFISFHFQGNAQHVVSVSAAVGGFMGNVYPQPYYVPTFKRVGVNTQFTANYSFYTGKKFFFGFAAMYKTYFVKGKYDYDLLNNGAGGPIPGHAYVKATRTEHVILPSVHFGLQHEKWGASMVFGVEIGNAYLRKDKTKIISYLSDTTYYNDYSYKTGFQMSKQNFNFHLGLETNYQLSNRFNLNCLFNLRLPPSGNGQYKLKNKFNFCPSIMVGLNFIIWKSAKPKKEILK